MLLEAIRINFQPHTHIFNEFYKKTALLFNALRFSLVYGASRENGSTGIFLAMANRHDSSRRAFRRKGCERNP